MIHLIRQRQGPRFQTLFTPALLSLSLLVVLAGCSSTSGNDSSLHHLTVGLTYVPNIQFAPFYVAEALGYYKAAGLEVTLQHQGVSESEFGAISAGQEDAIFAGGDEVLQAYSTGIPLTYVAQVYTQYPVALIVPAGSPIRSAADLRGHTIGIPGAYGTSYTALLAFLKSAGLSTSDVNIETIGYTQPAALVGHKVDAVIDYVNDGVYAYQQDNFPVRTIALGQPIVSNGIAVRDSVLGARPGDIRALIKATLQGVEYTMAHPEQAVKLSSSYIPDLNDPAEVADALATLHATIPFWQRSDGKPLGYSDPTLWQEMNNFLYGEGQLGKKVNVTKIFTNSYLPA
ncbi:MAG: ABC transporter substrate-binding protein [Ktedonobacterales bacterium]